jgi:sec-independent protein translocase protein TatC
VSAVPDAEARTSGGHMTIWEHIAELRSRLIRVMIAVAIGAIFGWILFPWVFDILQTPFRDLVEDRGGQIVANTPLQAFSTRLKVAGYLGIVFAMPVILWQVWRFVTPGLYPHEKKYAVPFTVVSMLLFLLGAALAYYTLNPALEFLIGVGGEDIEPYYTVDSYIMLIVWMMIGFGIGFEVPVLLVALQMVGILTPRKLLSWWRMAIVLNVVAAAVITPSGDPITMMALAVPMTLLYLMSIGVGALFLRLRRRKAERADSAT